MQAQTNSHSDPFVFRYITTFEASQSAAGQVGIAITEMDGPVAWHHASSGCTVEQGTAMPKSGAVGTIGRVHFSTTSRDNQDGMGGYALTCKQAARVSDARSRRDRIAVFSAQMAVETTRYMLFV
ncbi:unnamed protein product [Prorocentrum cordatum]|uniref:Subtilisin n=1 Tax=Prorocentrum cordatum TaxID=2364126 RepID=A0ABN9TGH5_9DINO|nr:unnamed protein product [Polarella glacialis]